MSIKTYKFLISSEFFKKIFVTNVTNLKKYAIFPKKITLYICNSETRIAMGNIGLDANFLNLTSKGGFATPVQPKWGENVSVNGSKNPEASSNSNNLGLVERLDRINCELTPVHDAEHQWMA